MQTLSCPDTLRLLLRVWLFFASLLAGPFTTRAAPEIAAPPVETQIRLGRSAIFQVRATGAGHLTYQWYRGSSGDTSQPVPGATAALLVSLPLHSSASFWVRITDAEGATDSPTARALVQEPGAQGLAGFGRNVQGQLTAATAENLLLPAQLMEPILGAAVGTDQTLVIRADHTLWGWGSNAHGQLGIGPPSLRVAPRQLAQDVIAVASGYAHILFLKTDGTLWAAGQNGHGQLGDGTIFNRYTPKPVATNVASIAAGGFHNLVLKTDGTAWTFGLNEFGQLGLPMPAPDYVPKLTHIADEVIGVAAGWDHSLLIKADGSLHGFGSNRSNQISPTSARFLPKPTLMATGVIQAAGGYNHTVLLKADGTAMTCGDNGAGQIGDGTTSRRTHPVRVADGIVSVAAGLHQTYFLRPDGLLLGTGDNSEGQLGDGTTASRSGPIIAYRGAREFFAGGDHVLVLAPLCTITFDLDERLGGGRYTQTLMQGLPIQAPPYTVATGWVFTGWSSDLAFAVGDTLITGRLEATRPPVLTLAPLDTRTRYGGPAVLSAAATANGALTYQWYRGEAGDTSRPVHGATGPLLVGPPQYLPDRYWVRIDNNGSHTDSPSASATPEGPLVAAAWGDNEFGQLGQSATFVPRPVQLRAGVLMVATSGQHTLVLDGDHRLWATGQNHGGQLGDGTTENRTHLVPVAEDVIAAVATNSSSAMLKRDGTLWTWGSNAGGQLGDRTTTHRSRPIHVANDATSLFGEAGWIYFNDSKGTFWVLTNTPTADFPGPGSGRPSDTGIAALARGASHSLLLKTDGTVWARGINDFGQLGRPGYDSPATAPLADQVISIAAGAQHSLWVRRDGTAWGCGRNTYGQLGDSTTQSRYTPIKLAEHAAVVAAGSHHSLIQMRDGALLASGFNSRGQIGDGGLVNRLRFVRVADGVETVTARSAVTLPLVTGHTVTFDPGPHGALAETESPTQIIGQGLPITLPSTVAAPGWLFAGWDPDQPVVTADLTVTARWVPDNGITINQPPGAHRIAPGDSTHLRAELLGSNIPAEYQWYRGPRGDTSRPIAGANGPLLVTPPLLESQSYWVRARLGEAELERAAEVVVAPHPTRLGVAGLGLNRHGQLGLGHRQNVSTPTQVPGAYDRVQAGANHTLLLSREGILSLTGQNVYHQLGSFGPEMSLSPVAFMDRIRVLAAGLQHSAVIDADQRLLTFGGNTGAQLGMGSYEPHEGPFLLSHRVVSCHAGAYLTFFVTDDGTLWGVGSYILGDYTETDYTRPVRIGTGAVSLSGGLWHTLLLKADGTLWSFGQNPYGQLGDGTLETRHLPVLIARDVVAHAAGASHSAYLTADGELFTFGYNHHGQLGDGGTTDRHRPQLLDRDVTAVAAGSNHTVYLRRDGILWGCGLNSAGQLGAAATWKGLRPIAAGVVGVTAGMQHTLFLAPLHTVHFDLGAHGRRSGGGAQNQDVVHGLSATAPDVIANPGWTFEGWDRSVIAVVHSLNARAIYRRTPETWASAHGLNGTAAAPQADPDGDGMPNLLEYALGSSPSTPSPAALPRPSQTNGHLALTFDRVTDPLLTYLVEATDSLSGGAWTTIWSSTGEANVAGSVTVADPLSLNDRPSRFLRLVVRQP